MNNDLSRIIDAFTALPVAQRYAVIVELARISEADAGPLSDDDLVAAGDALFRLYDDEEAMDGQAKSR
jgi:hypothetical protein